MFAYFWRIVQAAVPVFGVSTMLNVGLNLPPTHLPSNAATMLGVYGHLYYPGVQTLSRLLPRPKEAERPVVVLRLRGRTTVGATLINELSTYAEKLDAVHGRLYLPGIGERVCEQVVRTGRLHETNPVRVYTAPEDAGHTRAEDMKE